MPGYEAAVVYERIGLVCPHCKLLLRKAVKTDERGSPLSELFQGDSVVGSLLSAVRVLFDVVCCAGYS